MLKLFCLEWERLPACCNVSHFRADIVLYFCFQNQLSSSDPKPIVKIWSKTNCQDLIRSGVRSSQGQGVRSDQGQGVRSDQGQGAISEGLQKLANVIEIDITVSFLNREDNAKVAADSEKEGLKRQLQTIESFAKKRSDEISTYKKEVRCNMPVVKFYNMQKCSVL